MGSFCRTSTVCKTINITRELAKDVTWNDPGGDRGWLNSTIGNTIHAIYRISSGDFSSTHGAPNIDITDEPTEYVATDCVRLTHSPIHVDTYDFGPMTSSVTLSASSGGHTITVTSVDHGNRIVIKNSSPEIDTTSETIMATYTYREKYIPYYGTILLDTYYDSAHPVSDNGFANIGDAVMIPITTTGSSTFTEFSFYCEGHATTDYTIEVGVKSVHNGAWLSYEEKAFTGTTGTKTFYLDQPIASAGTYYVGFIITARSASNALTIGINDAPTYLPLIAKKYKQSGYWVSDTSCATFNARVNYGIINSESPIDIFDLCPYNGHKICIDGIVVNTSSMTGVPIYVYAMPELVMINGTVYPRDRVLYHTTHKELFDSSSIYYNPLALLIAMITIKDPGSTSKTTLIDTRSGGGGILLSDLQEYNKKNTFVDTTYNYNELEAFYDIGYLDGEGYLLGGSIVLTLPLTWKSLWAANGKTEDDVEAMVNSFTQRWVAAGKTVVIEWI
jgi:hypothetical protein